jgi:hypothetical protein
MLSNDYQISRIPFERFSICYRHIFISLRCQHTRKREKDRQKKQKRQIQRNNVRKNYDQNERLGKNETFSKMA